MTEIYLPGEVNSAILKGFVTPVNNRKSHYPATDQKQNGT